MRVFTEYGLCNCLETVHNLALFPSVCFYCSKRIYLFPSHVYEDIMFLVTHQRWRFINVLVTAFFTGLGPSQELSTYCS